MAFIAEDGTGLANANALATVAFCTAYHADRGNDAWALATNTKHESSIIRSTDYHEIRWAHRLKGDREFPGVQALSYPRINMKDELGEDVIGVPDRMMRAIAEYSLRGLKAPLMPDPKMDEAITKKKIGPFQKETEHVGRPPSMRRYPEADRLLCGYLLPEGGTFR